MRSGQRHVRSSPTRRCCTTASCPTTPVGRPSSTTCASSWSTSCTPCEVSSAPTSPRSCGGCGGWSLHYGGTEPTFVFTSATIGDRPAPGVAALREGGPSGHDRRVTPRAAGRSRCGTPPPSERSSESDGRWSVHAEAALLAGRLDPLRHAHPGVLPLPARHRAGRRRHPSRRRRRRRGPHPLVPRRLPARRTTRDRSGAVLGCAQGVVATNALELGVDIGGLDAVVLCGYPGTIASFWQQAGRTGRTDAPSLAVLVAGEDQLDQWMMRHPDQLFERAAEPAVINLDNPHVYVPHLACAAHELPLRHGDASSGPTSSTTECAGSCCRTADLYDGAAADGSRCGPAAVRPPRRSDCDRHHGVSTRILDELGRARRHRRRGPSARGAAPGRHLPAPGAGVVGARPGPGVDGRHGRTRRAATCTPSPARRRRSGCSRSTTGAASAPRHCTSAPSR